MLDENIILDEIITLEEVILLDERLILVEINTLQLLMELASIV